MEKEVLIKSSIEWKTIKAAFQTVTDYTSLRWVKVDNTFYLYGIKKL